jgi:hypothetical protein
MREIFFRGKRKYSDGTIGEWVFGSLSVMSGGGHAFIIDHSKDCIYEVDPSTVGQYAGVEDCSNAMRIYEGDILKDPEYGATAIVEWQGCGFVVRLKHGKYGVELPLKKVNDEWKVIGNIHDERPVEG